ncbi:hypothetical protein BKA70DRAFT_1374595 [Coprinopsis sp. MPI-PUGE-AT-0042]|nr:hypothetical protein BKA70DRAFT_1374595 [Coprinopsis sp. MPI-PUGE-AT-0042]
MANSTVQDLRLILETFFPVTLPYTEHVDREDIFSRLVLDLEPACEILGIDPQQPIPLFPRSPIILVTSRLDCSRCHLAGNPGRSLRRPEKPQTVRLLTEEFVWQDAFLFSARCITCHADYYPDRVTFPQDGSRQQQLEAECTYLRVSKSGVWMHRKVAIAQERAVARFHAGWSNFSDWLNETLGTNVRMTVRQSKRLFIEHFARRLLVSHQKNEDFICDANLNVDEFAASVREAVGKNGGIVPSSFEHSCMDCTHKKRYWQDLVDAGVELEGNENAIASIGDDADIPQLVNVGSYVTYVLKVPAPMAARPVQQDAPPAGAPRGYVRLAVMDGKTVGHRTCALSTCEGPLTNFKDGRFCQTHIPLKHVCGIIPCGQPVSGPGRLTCNNEAHQNWHIQYQNRFKRLTFPGIQRILRRQQEGQGANQIGQPALNIEAGLPQLGDIPGNEVVHTFRARTVYCVQTIQWACGKPIGWGKCYRSESAPQVLSILDRIWEGRGNMRPSYIAYDDACDLLRHIVTQDNQSPWLAATRFIVDAWHYVGHRATDALCRLWCNPAPMDGSQPDLIVVEEDQNGNLRLARAFNTETAEQLNAWITRYEAQLRQMSDVTFDFFIHVLMLLYGESVDARIERKERGLPDEFWDDVLG